jgi:hypothetical protein
MMTTRISSYYQFMAFATISRFTSTQILENFEIIISGINNKLQS